MTLREAKMAIQKLKYKVVYTYYGLFGGRFTTQTMLGLQLYHDAFNIAKEEGVWVLRMEYGAEVIEEWGELDTLIGLLKERPVRS